MEKVCVLFILITTCMNAQFVFINEIHYDNVGADVNEAIEVAGPSGTDLSDYSLILYNGNGGSIIQTKNLSGVIDNQQEGFGTLSFYISGIQNGPDAIALVNTAKNDLIQFLSYEGSFEATEGIALGLTSTDIVVVEDNTTETTESLQLIGTGSEYSDFTWSLLPATANQGSINNDQVFEPIILNNPQLEILDKNIFLFPNPSKTGTVFLSSPVEQVKVVVYNSLGAVINEQLINNGQSISFTVLPSGLYYAQLFINDKSITKKIIVE